MRLVAFAFALVLGLGGCGKRGPIGPPLAWQTVRTAAELKEAVAAAAAKRRPTVVEVYATWCHYCKEYEALFASNADAREALADVARLKIDTTHDVESELREAIGQMDRRQPYIAFFDTRGRLVPEEAIAGWKGRRSLGVFLRALAAARDR